MIPRPRLGLVVLLAACDSTTAAPDTDGAVDASPRPDVIALDTSAPDAAVSDVASTDVAPAIDTPAADVPVADVPVADVTAGSCTPPDAAATPPRRLAPGAVSATIVDPGGAPLGGVIALVCGTDLCSAPARTDASGRVSVTFNTTVSDPVLRVGDALRVARIVVPITTSGASLGTLHTVALPATGAALAPATSATSGPLTLTLAAGTVVAIDTLSYETPADQALRAALLPIAVAPVDRSIGLELVVVTAPQQTTFCPPARARVANSLAWPAGAAVDFYALGDDVSSAWAPYGGWRVLSAGHVTADGSAVETDPGAGLPVLTTLGLRRR